MLLLARCGPPLSVAMVCYGLHFSFLPLVPQVMDKAAGGRMAQLMMMWHGMHSSKAAALLSHKRMQGVCTALVKVVIFLALFRT